MTTSVVLADDHPLLLRGLRELLATAPEFDVVGATSSGTRAMWMVCTLQPDLAVLDIAMPDVGGMEIQRAILERGLGVRVVFLTATLTAKQVADSVALGVWGLVLKEYAPDMLLDCLQQVAQGERWLPADLVARANVMPSPHSPGRPAALTPRESEIADLVSEGLSNRAIAQRLRTSEGTVSIHLQNIYRKLDIKNRAMLAALRAQGRAIGGA